MRSRLRSDPLALSCLVLAITARIASGCSSSSSVTNTTSDSGTGGSGGNDAGPMEAGDGNTPACSDTCMPVPEGWSPAEIRGPEQGTCEAGESSLELVDDPSYASVSCECACGTPAPAEPCPAAFGQVLRGSSCDYSQANCYTTDSFVPDTCHPFELCAGQPPPSDFMLVDGAPNLTPVAGECEPRLVGRTVPEVTWADNARACVADARTGSCEGSAACVTRPMSCVLRPGDNICPEGYPDRRVLFETVVDTRDCTPCECGAVSVQCTNPRLIAYADPACTQQIETVALDACVQLTAQGPVDSLGLRYEVDTMLPSDCPPGGGDPVGTVAAVDEVTICCE